MSRFLRRTRGPRIAALFSYDYPSAEQAVGYEAIEALGGQMSAEVCVFYSAVVDPRALPAGLKGRVGDGVLVPGSAPAPYNRIDIDHFRAQCPARFASLVAVLTQVLGEGEELVLARQDVRDAFAYSRLIQAWAPDVIYSACDNALAWFAGIASRLLGVPHVVAMNRFETPRAHAERVSMLVRHAALIVLSSSARLEEVVSKFGEDLRARAVVRPVSDEGLQWLAGNLQRLLATPRDTAAPMLGPRATFAENANPHFGPPQGIHPFLVLGAERTGSNMLVEALSSHPQITCAGELFNPRAIESGEVYWLPDCRSDREELAQLRAAGPRTLHTRLLEDGAKAAASWVGFKLLYFHGLASKGVLSHLVNVKGLKVVHLLRADRLRRWLSHHKANLFDSWYAVKGSEPAGQDAQAAPLQLDLMKTVGDFAYIELMEDQYRAIFDGCDMIELDYESLTSDRSATQLKLGEFFGVELGELRSRSRKTGVHGLDRAIGNLEALREAMQGTRWAHLFAG